MNAMCAIVICDLNTPFASSSVCICDLRLKVASRCICCVFAHKAITRTYLGDGVLLVRQLCVDFQSENLFTNCSASTFPNAAPHIQLFLLFPLLRVRAHDYFLSIRYQVLYFLFRCFSLNFVLSIGRFNTRRSLGGYPLVKCTFG